MAVVFKSYEIVLIRVFLHAEFISAPRTVQKNGKKNINQNLWFLRNMQKMEKYYLLSLFSIFGDFCIKVSIKNS